MKRIITCLLIGILLLSLLPSAFAAEECEAYSAEMLMMQNLGIVYGYEDGTLRPQNNITRMEFVTMALRLMGYYDVDASYGENSAFSDVTPDLWGAKNINLSYQLGIIDGHAEGIFAPEEQVTVNQAVKVIACILGYKAVAEEKGYPTGYLTVGNQLGLLNGVVSGETPATRGAVASIMANALDAVIMEKLYYADGTETYVKTDKTLLDTMGIEKHIGFVYAVPGVTIGTEIELEENQALIGDTVYEVKCGDISDYIGSEVLIWVDVENQLYRPQIVHIEKSDTDREVTVQARDISSKTSRTALVYYNASGDEKTIDLNNRAPIIYNGKILTTAEATEEKLKPESGYVTVKNVNSEEFQVILVWDFQNYVVQTVSDKQIVYDLFGEKLDFSEESLVIDVVLDGETISLTELKSGDILSVAASLDGGYYKIFASRKTLNGTINSTKNTPQTVYNVTADGEKHALYLAKNYQRYLAQNSSKVSELYPGDSAVFYLDYFGDIAYSGDAVQQTNMQYGYIVDVADESSLFGSRSLHLKIMNETNQFVVYDVTKDDAFKYGVVENGVYVTKNNPFDTFCDQVIGTEGVIRQPVKYKTDVTGKLRECYLLDSVGSGDIWGDSVSTTYSYAYYNGTIDGQYLVDGNTIGFYIPSAGDEIELFKSGRAVTMMSSAAYDVQLYDIVDNRVGLVLIKTHIPSDNGYQYMLDMVNNPVMLIESVGKQLVDGESLTYVTGWQNGEVVTVTVADTLEENSDDRNLLQAGMLIQYLTNTEERSRAETSAEPEKMILFRTIEDFNRSSIPSYQKWNYMNNENSNAKIRVISGTVAAYDLPNMLVNCGANAAVSVDDGVNVICWNNKTKTAEKATIHDIMLNERVFVRTRYNVTKDIYIFE